MELPLQLLYKLMQFCLIRFHHSILDLDDSGNIGVKVLDSENIIRFVPIYIVEDLEEGLWISGIPGTVDLVVKGHGFVEDGQMILDSKSN